MDKNGEEITTANLTSALNKIIGNTNYSLNGNNGELITQELKTYFRMGKQWTSF